MSSDANWEYQAPEVIAKELLITYLERFPFPYPENSSAESNAQTLGQMFNALLAEVKRSF